MPQHGLNVAPTAQLGPTLGPLRPNICIQMICAHHETCTNTHTHTPTHTHTHTHANTQRNKHTHTHYMCPCSRPPCSGVDIWPLFEARSLCGRLTWNLWVRGRRQGRQSLYNIYYIILYYIILYYIILYYIILYYIILYYIYICVIYLYIKLRILCANDQTWMTWVQALCLPSPVLVNVPQLL